MQHWRPMRQRDPGGRAWWAAFASVLLHGGLAAGLLMFVRPPLPAVPPEPLTIELSVATAEPQAEPAAPAAEVAPPEPTPISDVPQTVVKPLIAPPKPVRAPRPATARAVPAPEGAPAPVVAAAAPAPVDIGWRNSFAVWLAAHRMYPVAARRDGTEGHATIRVVIAQDGAVMEAEMLAGTGSSVLDRAVAELLDAIRAARFPFPEGMAQARVAQTVTLRYALTP